MRNISFALTTDQVRKQTKTVTRRLGWKTLKAGTLLQPVVKGMGLKKGETVERIGGPIEVVDVWRGPLERMCGHEDFAASDEARLEGFPQMCSEEFVAFFCKANGCAPDTEVTRIEFRYLPVPSQEPR